MDYIIVFALCFLATSKVTLQSFYSKGHIKNVTDAVFYNAAVFLVSAALFGSRVMNCSPKVWLYGGAFGILTILFQLTYTKALSFGNVTLTVMIVNLGMIIPIAVSILIYQEQVTIYRLIGIILTLAIFLMSVEFRKGSNYKQWVFLALAAFAANGGLSVVQKFFGESEYSNESQAFTACAYITAAILTWGIYLFLKPRQPRTFAINKKFLVYVALIGSILAIFQAFNTYAVSVVDGTFLFPAYAGGGIIFSTLSGVLLFKDRLNTKQKIGVVLGVAAVVCMNF